MPIGAAIAGVGGSLASSYLGYKGTKDAARSSANASRYAADLQNDQYLQGRQDLSPYREVAVGKEQWGTTPEYQRAVDEWRMRGSTGAAPVEADFQGITGYEGGALNTLSDYGRSQVDPNSFIPQSNIPQYQGSQIGVDPNVNSNVSGYDPNFDLSNNPAYNFRQNEQERSINRNMAAMGKITSGNRLNEIMQRSGEMASQEFENADRRNARDFGLNRGVEDSRYNRGVDQYGRAYSQDKDQYGRDLTSYNADLSRENSLYGRGVDDYGRAYGQETDYLNRQASLADIGQTATNSSNALGANSAAKRGDYIQAAGDATGAGYVGGAKAIGEGINQLSQAAGNYFNNNQPGYADGWVSDDPSVWG